MVRRLLSAGAVGALAALAAASGPAAGGQRHVALTISITGNGSVRLVGGGAVSCTSACTRRVLVPRGATVRLQARAGAGWAFSYWGGACWAAPGSACRLRLRHSARAIVSFLAPGSTAKNAVPLGQSAAVDTSWSVTVDDAALDATAQLLAIPANRPPRKGMQFALVHLSATYTGTGLGSLENAMAFYAVGAQGRPYDRCEEKLPPPPLPLSEIVYPGQTVSGNVCYELAARDAASLLLFAGYYEQRDQSEHKVWFALR
jgi:hypothetical protein